MKLKAETGASRSGRDAPADEAKGDETMTMQKYRADVSKTQPDGAVVWSSQWIGGPSLAKIENCRLINMAGDMRRTVYITGEADTYFSIPAVCSLAGCRVRGYITGDDAGNLVFHHTYY